MVDYYNTFITYQNWVFKIVINLVTIIILYILLLALFVGVINILLNIKSNLLGTLGGGFSQIVSNALTIFVIIDLFKTFVDYRDHEEIKIAYATDATILIVMREIAVGVYDKNFEYQFILGSSVLLLILGIIKALSVKYPSRSWFLTDLL